MLTIKTPLFKWLFLSIVLILASEIANTLLGLEDLLYNSLSEQLTSEQLQNYFQFKDKWQWLGYVFTPLFLLIKVAIIAAILDIGCFFFEQQIKYKTLFDCVVKAEFVFVLVVVFKTVWFYVFQQDYTLQDLQSFYPLSVLNIVGYEDLHPWFIYPLQVLNVFELVYWFVLANLLSKVLNITTHKGMGIVASSYGLSLVIWVVAVMFFTLNMS